MSQVDEVDRPATAGIDAVEFSQLLTIADLARRSKVGIADASTLKRWLHSKRAKDAVETLLVRAQYDAGASASVPGNVDGAVDELVYMIMSRFRR